MGGAEATSVDTLVCGAVLVTLDAERRVIADGVLAIKDDRIVAVGTRAELAPRYAAAETIDARGFVATPGFVNGHVHITETLIKGFIPENLGFDEGVWRWSVPLYEIQTPEEQSLAARLSAVAMLRTGTTAFLEAGTVIALDPVFEAVSETGIRGRIGQWVLDRARDAEDQDALTDKAIGRLADELARYPGKNGERLAAWPLLIGHMTNTDRLWQAAKQLADAHGAGISAHMSPVEGDPDWYLAYTGRRPVEHLAELGVLGPNLCLTHMVHVDDAEVALLAETGTRVIHCPAAGLKGGFGMTTRGRFPEMAARGVPIALGTDGADSADLMRAIWLVAGLFKDARRDASLFPAREALAMATLGGAAALGLSADIGSLEAGKKADFVLHDTRRPEWTPLVNAVNQLVWSADGRGVHSVWVDGRRVVDNYRCTTIDEEKLFADAQAASAAIVARSGLPVAAAWPTE